MVVIAPGEQIPLDAELDATLDAIELEYRRFRGLFIAGALAVLHAEIENALIDEALEAERRGVPLPVPDHGSYRPNQAIDRATRLSRPLGPFVAWLEDMVARVPRPAGIRRPAEEIVATRLGVGTRTLYRWRYEFSGTVDDAIVEYAASRYGTTAEAIYGTYGSVPALPGLPSVSLDRPECADPDCAERASAGRFGCFCREHAAMLAEIRDEFDAEREVMARNGGASRRESKAALSKVAVCCNPNCWHERTPPAAFCDKCLADGYVEEDLPRFLR